MKALTLSAFVVKLIHSFLWISFDTSFSQAYSSSCHREVTIRPPADFGNAAVFPAKAPQGAFVFYEIIKSCQTYINQVFATYH